jgi:hypothetical protein
LRLFQAGQLNERIAYGWVDNDCIISKLRADESFKRGEAYARRSREDRDMVSSVPAMARQMAHVAHSVPGGIGLD